VFRRIAAAIGEPQLADDPRFKTALARVDNEDAIDDRITRWTSQHTCGEAEMKLHAAAVPAARIYTVADIFKDPHYAARGMLARVPDDDLGEVTLANVVPKLSETPGAIRHSGHRVGQDTRRVLMELAGLSAEDIAELETHRIIACDRTGDCARSVEASEAS
jgi:crotonobetainyl-CoA:carnitine CoA-transferase CaiB-like acyl-CoA transferase